MGDYRVSDKAAPMGQTAESSAAKAKADDTLENANAVRAPSKQQKQAAKRPISDQSAATQVSPSSALSVQTGTAPHSTHDDIPASPATVASAIEEVLKNGGAHGAQTEEDDAWLARIHLLNGGQNMPKFGGFGPNGGSGLNEEAEMQAAKKAERAVAAAWGAGKNVWNKSQQQNQQQTQSDVNKNATAASSSEAVPKDSMASGKQEQAKASSKGGDAQLTSTPVAVNGTAENDKARPSSLANESRKAAVAAGGKASASGADASAVKNATSNQKSRVPADQQKAGKGTATQTNKATAASVPSFEDVNNWPSPLDAGKKPADKPRTCSIAGHNDKSEANKASQPKTQKSLYETLDELQVRLAPGANLQQTVSAAGARKGKQQWVSILPEITHASNPSSGAKGGRPATDARAGKGANKSQQQQQQQQTQQPQRKEGSKGSGHTTQAAQTKKDGANRTKAARAEDKAQVKEGEADASVGNKVSETRSKDETRIQPAMQSDKAGAGTKLSAQSNAASPQSQTQAAKQGHHKAAESAPVITEQQSSSTVSAVTSARGEVPAKPAPQAPQAPQASQPQPARANLRAPINGNSTSSFQPQPNGVRPASKSGACSGTGTPRTNRSSPRGSVASSPKVHALPRAALPISGEPVSNAYAPPPPPPSSSSTTTMFYGPSGAATPMLAAGPGANGATWLPYNPYVRPAAYMLDATAQTGAPLPAGVLGQLLAQVEFYFSQQNLQGDFFLRQKMDTLGWVDIPLVARFNRVRAITKDINLVKDALLCSAVLDVDEHAMRVRRRWGWEEWTLASGDAGNAEKLPVEDEDDALGVVSASGLGGTFEP